MAKVLYTVLNWGLGHASRSIPIIEYLIQNEIPVIIASDGESLELLKREFPTIGFEKLPSYNIHYPKKGKNFNLSILSQLHKIRLNIKREKNWINLLLKKHQCTHIISDNRYGSYNLKIPSAIVCHQLNIQLKREFLSKIVNFLHHKMLNKFDEIWIPDFEKNSIAGELSHIASIGLKQKSKYIGLLSNLKKSELKKQYDFCVILSGPEPQRTILENKLYRQIVECRFRVAFVRGTNFCDKKIDNTEKVKVFSLIGRQELNKIINQSEFVICRSGYSSIMDLIKLEKNAVLIPTPGQTEQEYLAEYLRDEKQFFSTNQDYLNLSQILNKFVEKFSNKNKQEELLMENTVRSFLSKR